MTLWPKSLFILFFFFIFQLVINRPVYTYWTYMIIFNKITLFNKLLVVFFSPGYSTISYEVNLITLCDNERNFWYWYFYMLISFNQEISYSIVHIFYITFNNFKEMFQIEWYIMSPWCYTRIITSYLKWNKTISTLNHRIVYNNQIPLPFWFNNRLILILWYIIKMYYSLFQQSKYKTRS